MASVNLKIGLLSGIIIMWQSLPMCLHTLTQTHSHILYIHVTHARFVKHEENKQNNKNPQKFSA